MKHFSLKEYLKNPARKVITREGNSVEIIYTNAEGRYPIVAVVTKEDGKKLELNVQYMVNGQKMVKVL